MLINFSVKNFLSIKDEITLSMLPVNSVKELREENIFDCGNQKLLKTAVIYGANASGKSNLLSAILFMRWFIINSSKESQSEEEIDVKPFLFNVETGKKPSFFEITFLYHNLQYRYGFEADSKRIHSEWLFRKDKREVLLFFRQGKEIDIKTGFKEGRGLENKTRENALFLSVVAQFNGKISNKVLEGIKDLYIISGLDDFDYRDYTAHEIKEKTEVKTRILHLLGMADLEIKDIQVSEFEMSLSDLPSDLSESVKKDIIKLGLKGRKIFSLHNQYDSDGNIVGLAPINFERYESKGTIKFFSLLGPIIDVLDHGYTLIVDELDARFHPLMTHEIIALFNNPKVNTKGAQLIFATHDVIQLKSGQFRRDQIWFTEKGKIGDTRLTSLVEYKVRKEINFADKYITGRFGAIPYLFNFGRGWDKVSE